MPFSSWARRVTACIGVYLIVMPVSTHASWQAFTSTGGYMGRVNVGALYETKSETHHFALSYGETRDEAIGTIPQYTFFYLATPWKLGKERWVWEPFSLGAFITYTSHDAFFVDAGHEYEDDSYYDDTVYRAGLLTATGVSHRLNHGQKISLSAFVATLDQGLTSYAKNSGDIELDGFNSFGVMLAWQFKNDTAGSNPQE